MRHAQLRLIAMVSTIVGTACVADSTEPTRSETGTSTAPISAGTATPAEEARMRAYLEDRYRGVVVRHSFRTPKAKDLIDCVDINSQPSLIHTGEKLRNEPPSPLPPASGTPTSSATAPAGIEAQMDLYSDTPDEEGHERRCPPGTIPMIRPTLEDLKRFSSIEAWRAKGPNGFGRTGGRRHHSGTAPFAPGTGPHQYAISAEVTATDGIESTINIWETVVNQPSELSISQVWVAGEFLAGGPVQTVEAGVVDYPAKFGNGLPRLFVFYTPDDYTTARWNFECAGGFVQVNSLVTPGGAFSSYSAHGGTQVDGRIVLQKNANSDWWFAWGQTWIGYWPKARFNGGPLSMSATYIEAGGEISDDRIDGHHTDTDMGSGRFPYSYYPNNYTWVAYQRRLIKLNYNGWSDMPLAPLRQTEPICYKVQDYGSAADNWRNHLYLGGQGYDPSAGCL